MEQFRNAHNSSSQQPLNHHYTTNLGHTPFAPKIQDNGA
jgi:hypothetical protein